MIMMVVNDDSGAWVAHDDYINPLIEQPYIVKIFPV